MVGGPSIVFKRYHESGVTKIRPHRVKTPKTCAKIVGYDANALYLSAMARGMPGGKGVVVANDNPRLVLLFCHCLISYVGGLGTSPSIMGLTTQDPYIQKEHTELYKIFKFRANWANIEQDTAIQKLQNLQRNVWISGQVSGNPYICY